MRKKVILWILVIACAAAIFALSDQRAEDSNTVSSGFIAAVFSLFRRFRELDETEKLRVISDFSNIVRKLAHFSIYALLGFLTKLLYDSYGFKKTRAYMFTVCSCCLYAVSDELHQLFVSGRSGELRDIFIDTFGAAVGGAVAAAAAFAVIKIKEGKNKNV